MLTGKRVIVIGDRNPSNGNRFKEHHIGHYLVDDSEAVIMSVSGDKYHLRGISKSSGDLVTQTLHKGQVRII